MNEIGTVLGYVGAGMIILALLTGPAWIVYQFLPVAWKTEVDVWYNVFWGNTNK